MSSVLAAAAQSSSSILTTVTDVVGCMSFRGITTLLPGSL
jgi:Mg/Co/Ni transporter MgtE